LPRRGEVSIGQPAPAGGAASFFMRTRCGNGERAATGAVIYCLLRPTALGAPVVCTCARRAN
jgi:hypothetical protein